MTTTCKHGQLARSCELCEKDTEIERLREELAEAKRRIAAAEHGETYNYGVRVGAEHCDKLREQLAASKNLEETYRAEVVKLSRELATAKGLLVEGRYVELYEENRRIEAELDRLRVQPAQEPVGHVYRYGKDSHGREWHGIHWYDPNLDVPTGTKLYTTSQSAEIDQLKAALEKARKALHKLACLGNGAHYGTSDGNRIAQVALAEIDAAMKEKP